MPDRTAILELVEDAAVLPHKMRFRQQVLGRVTGQRELGERDDVRALRLGRLDLREDLFRVAVQVADHGVHLGEGDFDLHR